MSELAKESLSVATKVALERLNALPHFSWSGYQSRDLTFKQKLNRWLKGYLSFYYGFTIKNLCVDIRFEDGRLDLYTRTTTVRTEKTFRFYYPKPLYTVKPHTLLIGKNSKVPYSITLKTK